MQTTTEEELQIKFYCQEHTDCEKQAVCLSEKSPFKSRFVCLKCVISLNDMSILKKTFPVKDLIAQPKTIFESIIPNTKIPAKKNLFQGLNDLKKFVLQFQELLNKQLLILFQQYDLINDTINTTLEDLEKNMKFDEFKQKYQDVWGKKNHIETYEYQMLEKFLQDTCTVNKDFQKAFDIRKVETIEKGMIAIIDNLNVEIQNFCSNSVCFLKDIKEKLNLSLENEDINSFPELHEQISQGKQVKYELIYKGTRDGMTAGHFWQKCNMQDHLLIMMESKNGTKFGGYTPLLWDNSNQNWQMDPNLQSFQFSQTKKQIYNQIKKGNTLRCNPKCGPWFGEMRIDEDFQTGDCSNLGTIFDANKYIQTDKPTHFFGGPQPQLKEILVFKVIFY